MSRTPMQVLTRPFAVEPVTNVMLPDGIFDNAIYGLRICCHCSNTGNAPLNNVQVYLESVGDPGIAVSARTWTFATVPPGASVRVWWQADFQHAAPGKTPVSFVARADGLDSRRSIRQIFVSQTRYDPATSSYSCTVGEGALTVSGIRAIGPSAEAWWRCGPERPSCPPTAYGPWVPTGLTMAWAPNPSYAGVHGELPFADPWHKVVALIVLAVAGLTAIIAAALGAGKAHLSVSGPFEETEPSTKCCTPTSASSGKLEFTVAGAGLGNRLGRVGRGAVGRGRPVLARSGGDPAGGGRAHGRRARSR